MKKKSIIKIFLSPAIATSLLAVIFFAACTKADYSDDFKPSPPPPIGDYNTADDVAKDALVAKWSFENTVDDSIQHLVGFNSGVTFTAGLKGQGYQGSDVSYATYKQPGTIPSLHAFTVSFWMKPVSINGLARGIFSLNNKNDFWGSLDIYLDNPTLVDTFIFKVHLGSLVAGVSQGQFTDTKVIGAQGKWTNMIITYDDKTSIFNVYQNSQQLGINVGGQTNVRGPVLYVSGTTTPYGPLDFIGNNATAIVMGTWQWQPNDPDINNTGPQSWAGSFNGGLDEFRIYNRALTSNEVSALFKLEKLGL